MEAKDWQPGGHRDTDRPQAWQGVIPPESALAIRLGILAPARS